MLHVTMTVQVKQLSEHSCLNHLVMRSVQRIFRMRHRHHLSTASNVFAAVAVTAQVSAPYRKIGGMQKLQRHNLVLMEMRERQMLSSRASASAIPVHVINWK